VFMFARAMNPFHAVLAAELRTLILGKGGLLTLQQ